MDYIRLNNTDLRVSPVCLGTSQFGTGISAELALWQLDAFAERGGNFLDTALVYGDWGKGEKAISEKLLGRWLKDSGKREKMVIMTKGGHPLLETMSITRCTPKDVMEDIESSLSNLGLDCIDLYLLHRDNTSLPVDVLLDTLEEAKMRGRISHYGFSNWTYDRIREAESYSVKAGIGGFICNQIRWSLAEPNTENISDKSMMPMSNEIMKWHKKTGTNVTAYNSTAGGWFTKLEKSMEIRDSSKKLYSNDINDKIFLRIKEAAKDLNLSTLDISLAYIRSQSFPSIPITSFTKKEQLEEALVSCETILPPDLVKELSTLKGLV